MKLAKMMLANTMKMSAILVWENNDEIIVLNTTLLRDYSTSSISSSRGGMFYINAFHIRIPIRTASITATLL